MIVLAKPISNPNPRNSQLYEFMQANEAVDVLEFSAFRLLFKRFDVLHIHWPDRIFYWKIPAVAALGVLGTLFLIAKVKGGKIVYTCHNFFPKNRVSRCWLRLYFSILRWGVDGVICPRGDFVGRVSRIFPKARISFVPLGLLNAPEQSDDSILSDLFDSSRHRGYLLIPGIQEPTKKTELAIDKILQWSPGRSVLVVGKFTEPTYLAFLLARYSTSKNVEIRDRYLSDVQLATLIRRADAVVASQHKGSNSGIALLSIALGKPCFCATASLASAVRRDYTTSLAMSLKDLESWGDLPRERQRCLYTMDYVASRTNEFYNDVLGYA